MDEFKDMQFPAGGIDLTLEVGGQRSGTTREANNVRLYEPGTGRARGGSRPGLGRYIDTTVNGAHLVQHLAVIVDPTVEGLLADLDYEGDLTDPSTSNRRRRLPTSPARKMRTGGNGRSPTIKTPRRTLTITATDQSKTQGSTFTFTGTEFSSSGLGILDSITSATIASIGSAASRPVGSYPITIKNAIGVTGEGILLKRKYRIVYVPGTMTVSAADLLIEAGGGINGTPPGDPLIGEIALTSVTAGNLIVFWVANANVGGYSISSSMGNVYTQAGTTKGIGSNHDYKMYYGVASGSGAETITITLANVGGGEAFYAVCCLFQSFSGTPLENANGASGSGTSWATGSIAATQPTEMTVACFASFLASTQSIVGPSGTSFLLQLGVGAVLFDITIAYPSTTGNPTLSASVSQDWAGIGGSFK